MATAARNPSTASKGAESADATPASERPLAASQLVDDLIQLAAGLLSSDRPSGVFFQTIDVSGMKRRPFRRRRPFIPADGNAANRHQRRMLNQWPCSSFMEQVARVPTDEKHQPAAVNSSSCRPHQSASSLQSTIQRTKLGSRNNTSGSE
jgi:hypothetical protein